MFLCVSSISAERTFGVYFRVAREKERGALFTGKIEEIAREAREKNCWGVFRENVF